VPVTNFVWDGALQFIANAGDHETRMDGERRTGGTPMELLMATLAGCMGMDLVYILGRMRSELKSMRAQIEGVRADSYPQRFIALSLHFEISGADIDAADVDRAIALSRETYCSVYASLRPDIDMKITYKLTG
jgi:putative redox protein